MRRMCAGALIAAMSATVYAGPAGAAPQCPDHRWVGSWAAAQSDGLGGLSGAPLRQATPLRGATDATYLAGGTLRLVLTPHLGGHRLRVRLSNRFGQAPLTFDRATVARAAGGAAVRPPSIRALTFGGSRSVTIPAGAEVVSDPTALRFDHLERLAVSLYSARPLGPVTEHFTARQTSFSAPVALGDRTADARPDTFAASTTTRPFVAAVDVLADGGAGAVVALGDSITDGYGGLPNGTLDNPVGINENPDGMDADQRWPDELRRRLIDAGRPLAVLNAGISGNRILADGAEGKPPIYAVYGPAARKRLDVDVLAQTGVTDVIVLEGINDIGFTPATGAEVIDGLSELVTRIRQAGLRVHLGTLTPIGGSGYDTPEAEAARTQVNAWIRGQDLSHGIVDFDAAVRDTADPGQLDPRYDSGDGLHPSPAGYRAMAGAVDLALLRGVAHCD